MWFHVSPACLWVTVSFWMPSFTPVTAQDLTDKQISVISGRLAQGASHSWEYGTRSEVLLEYNAPSYSVLSSSPVPPPQQIPSNSVSALSDVFSIARMVVGNYSVHAAGPQPLMQDSSAGDPASIGVAVLLANWTGQGTSDKLDYAGAARDQLAFLLQKVPKTHDGAISHRTGQVQLWSDSVYMVPPFLAYYGVVTRNISLVREACNQISLYRKYLRDTGANNLWKHIVQPGSYNSVHWSTGNAWAAAGMIRVLGTIQGSQYANALKQEQEDLSQWIQEIHNAMYAHLDGESGLFHNDADDMSMFLDASSTALLASTVYRLASLRSVHTHVSHAEFSRQRLSAQANSSWLHFTADGWLTPVVDPYMFKTQGKESPEGQAFVIAMQAAWRDWVAQG